MPPKEIGRNDPCPCGSGKKYKKCCMIKPLKRKVTLLSSGLAAKPLDLFQRAVDLQSSRKEGLRIAAFVPTKHSLAVKAGEEPLLSKPLNVEIVSEEVRQQRLKEEELGRQSSLINREASQFTPSTTDYSSSEKSS